jgi:hypothetical protein
LATVNNEKKKEIVDPFESTINNTTTWSKKTTGEIKDSS